MLNALFTICFTTGLLYIYAMLLGGNDRIRDRIITTGYIFFISAIGIMMVAHTLFIE